MMLQLVDRARREVVVHFSNSDVVGGEVEGDGCRAHGLVAFYQKKDFSDKDLSGFCL